MRENLGTGPRVRSLPARHGEKDQMAAKRVESFRVPCLDAGSTPATSTENQLFFDEFPCNPSDYGDFFYIPCLIIPLLECTPKAFQIHPSWTIRGKSFS